MSTRRLFRLSLAMMALCFITTSTTALADIVNWRTNLDAAKIEASQANKLVLLHFWTPSCGPCRQLDTNVFSQPQIGQLLEQNYIPVKINADLSPAIAGLFNIDRVPTDIVLTPQGNVVAKLSCPPTPSDYGTQLLNLSQHYRQQVAAHNIPAQAPMHSAYAGLKVGQYNNAAVATAPNNPYQTPPTNQALAGQASGAAVTPPTGPQVTYNAYTSAAANPQTAGKVVNAMPGRYQNQQIAAAAPQLPSAAIQPTAAQLALQPSQRIALPSGSAAIGATASAANVAKAQPAPIKLPAGSPPLAFEGYCPTTLKHARKWVPGDPKFGAIHRGRTYLFIGEPQRQQFLANPDQYSPVFSGIDPVKLLDENKTVAGTRKFGYEYREKFYLFSSQESMDRFEDRPDLYAAGVRQAMVRMDGGTGVIRR